MIINCRNHTSVTAGDLVLLNGRLRLVAYVGKRSISFVRFGSSWCWKKYNKNATAFYSLPIELTVVLRASLKTRELAQRFSEWLTKPVTDTDWQRVCDMSVAAIKCECDS